MLSSWDGMRTPFKFKYNTEESHAIFISFTNQIIIVHTMHTHTHTHGFIIIFAADVYTSHSHGFRGNIFHSHLVFLHIAIIRFIYEMWTKRLWLLLWLWLQPTRYVYINWQWDWCYVLFYLAKRINEIFNIHWQRMLPYFILNWSIAFEFGMAWM